MGRLSATTVKAAKESGRYGDGDGLYLVVTARGSKSWVCRVQKNGKRRDIGLGSVKEVPLAPRGAERLERGGAGRKQRRSGGGRHGDIRLNAVATGR
ncbi:MULTISPECIES: Arm DNA-binding domain-containing protein [Acidiphilium]|uniref:Arm DNA-binding domain-containing protein n=1 Tax=Acidiphilium iwatense TaxID=768198 RepID=A0ABS9E3D6_9PROT|nr:MULTISPECIES: Arm DNA-binding domain-containing protein [Acidiphilium]MCF3948550.1 Arm DNA-binding domain-containing protein [Acidiphilium iwatense]